jgi:hypothetical protein
MTEPWMRATSNDGDFNDFAPALAAFYDSEVQ